MESSLIVQFLLTIWWMFVKGSVVVCTLMLLARFFNGRPTGDTRTRKLRVAFLHPDLGIGGAERLVVDAAVGLQQMHGCDVTIYTNHHDPARCFEETRDGTLKVRVVCSRLPRAISGKMMILLATLKMMLLSLYLAIPFIGPKCDVYVVDQVAGAMMWLKLLTRRGVFFYCHHPDQLCDPNRVGPNAPKPRGFLRRVYRHLFDVVEGIFMTFSDRTVCNSKYTLQVTQSTFPGLPLRSADVLYPPINIEALTRPPPGLNAISLGKDAEEAIEFRNRIQAEGQIVLLSLNRYERKKNIGLAIEAFDHVLGAGRISPSVAKKCHLYVAGGYDPRLPENVEHHQELQDLAFKKCKNTNQSNVTFLRSISLELKYILLSQARCIIYTPTNEHFGIVPVEGMAHGKVVVAVNKGGPTESIGVELGDQFGLLRDPEANAFGGALERVLEENGGEELCRMIGKNAKNRVNELFSLETFSRRTMEYLEAL